MANRNGIYTSLLALNADVIDVDTVRLEMVPLKGDSGAAMSVKGAIRRETDGNLIAVKVAQFSGAAFAVTGSNSLDFSVKNQAGSSVRAAGVLDIKSLGSGQVNEVDFPVDQNASFSAGDLCRVEIASAQNSGGDDPDGSLLVHLVFEETD